jgi:hypothetical protein
MKEHGMDLQTAAVEHRLDELREVSSAIRTERQHRARSARLSQLRIVVGRRLIALGDALLDGVSGQVTIPTR